MSYEDVIRVADLKIRRGRFDRVRSEVRVETGQLIDIVEYMHPRLDELCDIVPARLGRFILARKTLVSVLQPLFRKGRNVRTTSVRWFLLLALLAQSRRWRRVTLRYQVEQARIEDWLALIRDASTRDRHAAFELVECQGLIKGYSETYARGLSRYLHIVSAYHRLMNAPDLAAQLRTLRLAAVADEEGAAFNAALAEVNSQALAGA
jgi:indolepyruvate ferredoxin oxidoreductase, beta subunit